MPSCTKSPTAHLSAFRWPSAGARSVCSIFMASSTRSGAPRCSSAPGSARMRVTVPGIGATMRLAAAASATSATNGSIQCSARRPRGVARSRSRPDQVADARSGASPRQRSNTSPSRGDELQAGIACRRIPWSVRRGRTRARRRNGRAPWRKLRRRLRRPAIIQPSVRSQGEGDASDAGCCSLCSRSEHRAQAAARSSAAIAALRLVSAEISRSMKPVSISPRDHLRMARAAPSRKARLVVTPAISNSPRASTMRASACGRSAPQAISFASSAS